MRKRVQEILDMLGVDIDPTQRMDEIIYRTTTNDRNSKSSYGRCKSNNHG